MHDQRPGRARRQRVARGDRDGGASTRRDVFPCTTRIDTTQIVPASKLVSGITGFPVQPNKAIVGANAFAHESGIHQDGVLKHRETYEIMRAEDVGWGANKLVLGKLSGRNAFRTRLAELGIELPAKKRSTPRSPASRSSRTRRARSSTRICRRSSPTKAIVPAHEHYRLVALKVMSETGTMPHARVVMTVGDARGASRKSPATDRSTRRSRRSSAWRGSHAQLLLYSVNAITSGTDAQGEVTVRLERDGRIVNGTRRRHRHHRRVRQGLHQCAEQAARRRAAPESATGCVRRCAVGGAAGAAAVKCEVRGKWPRAEGHVQMAAPCTPRARNAFQWLLFPRNFDMNAPRYGPGIEISAPVTPEFAEILTPEAVAFAARLQRAFGGRRTELLARARGPAGSTSTPASCPDFLPETRAVRDGDWTCAPVPAGHRGPARRDHRAGRPQDGDQRAQFGRQACSWPISRTPTRRAGTTTSRARSTCATRSGGASITRRPKARRTG